MTNPYYKYLKPETGEFNEKYNEFRDAVARLTTFDFDCNDVVRAMDLGLTPAQCAQQIEDDYDPPVEEDFEDRLNHDHSMNG